MLRFESRKYNIIIHCKGAQHSRIKQDACFEIKPTSLTIITVDHLFHKTYNAKHVHCTSLNIMKILITCLFFFFNSLILILFL